MMKYLHYNARAILYSIIVTLGVILLMTFEAYSPKFYILVSILIYFIILFEIFFTWFNSREKLKQLDLPLIHQFSQTKEFLHHFLLPTFVFGTLSGFIYFNNQAAIQIPVIIFSLIAFSSLFINVRAYYQDKFKLEEETYYVYDLIELMVFFGMTNTILHIYERFDLSIILVSLLIFILSFLLFLINIYQIEKVNIRSLSIILGFSIFISLILYIFLINTTFNILSISAQTFLSYYITYGILVHMADGSLTKSIILEYISVFFLSIAFLFGIS